MQCPIILSAQINRSNGTDGEQEIVATVPCPNCSKRLMTLPISFPLYDVQCSACLFRAQVKTNACKPKPQIFGSGWDIMEKTLKAGHLVPPLFLFFKWEEQSRKTM